MTRHQKRLAVPNSWPVERKTNTFTVKAGAGPHGEAGVPLVVLLRDVLGYVDSTKEARYALNNDSVLVNGDAISDEQRPIGMFDILAFPERGGVLPRLPRRGRSARADLRRRGSRRQPARKDHEQVRRPRWRRSLS